VKCKKIYIDAFAGSGFTEIKSGEVLVGSALSSLRYDFDKYYFLDINEDNIRHLPKYIAIKCPEKLDKINFIVGDCNTELKKILASLNKYQRGVIFLDPYAMELEWNILNDIQATSILDVWYLFPFSAVNRNLFKNREIPKANKEKLDKIFGDDTWESALYKESIQQNFLGEIFYDKASVDEIREYILGKMKKVFPHVSSKSRFLKTSTHSPLFLLCYAISNDSPKAIALGDKVVTDIIKSIEKGAAHL
jgi:three-Cys-motif partner protein